MRKKTVDASVGADITFSAGGSVSGASLSRAHLSSLLNNLDDYDVADT